MREVKITKTLKNMVPLRREYSSTITVWTDSRCKAQYTFTVEHNDLHDSIILTTSTTRDSNKKTVYVIDTSLKYLSHSHYINEIILSIHRATRIPSDSLDMKAIVDILDNEFLDMKTISMRTRFGSITSGKFMLNIHDTLVMDMINGVFTFKSIELSTITVPRCHSREKISVSTHLNLDSDILYEFTVNDHDGSTLSWCAGPDNIFISEDVIDKYRYVPNIYGFICHSVNELKRQQDSDFSEYKMTMKSIEQWRGVL